MYPNLTVLRRRLERGPYQDTIASIEAAVIYRCVTQPMAHTRASALLTSSCHSFDDIPGALACFDSAAAAHRFAGALRQSPGTNAWVDQRQHGIRHRHELHFVRVDPEQRGQVRARLAQGWKAAMSIVEPIRSTHPLARRRQAIAQATWRALLLTSNPIRSCRGLRVRLRDNDLIALATRAAGVLEAATSVRALPGARLVCIDDPDAAQRLVDQLTERAVPRPRVPSEPTRRALRPAVHKISA